jgi:hypothetical protein
MKAFRSPTDDSRSAVYVSSPESAECEVGLPDTAQRSSVLKNRQCPTQFLNYDESIPLVMHSYGFCQPFEQNFNYLARFGRTT